MAKTQLALFLKGSDVGTWARPVKAAGPVRRVELRGFSRTHWVTQDAAGNTHCTCRKGRRGRSCKHIRALAKFNLID